MLSWIFRIRQMTHAHPLTKSLWTIQQWAWTFIVKGIGTNRVASATAAAVADTGYFSTWWLKNMMKDKWHEYILDIIIKCFRVLLNVVSLRLSLSVCVAKFLPLTGRNFCLVFSFISRKKRFHFSFNPIFECIYCGWSWLQNEKLKIQKKTCLSFTMYVNKLGCFGEGNNNLAVYLLYFARCAEPFCVCAVNRTATCDSECYFMIPISISSRAHAQT